MGQPNFTTRTVWTGDNLDILRGINSESIDLIYLDPPFNSNRNYTAPIGSKAAGVAFKDTWTLDDVDEAWHGEIADRDPSLYSIIDAAGLAHGASMKSYLIMMAVRLLEMRRVLKPTGSIYLHCDLTASHYVKTLMDSVFGAERFLNEVTWKRSSAHSDSKQGMRRCGRIRDILLVYTKEEEHRWNTQFTSYSEEYLREKYRHQDPDGRRFKDTDLSGAKPGGDTSYEWRVKRRIVPEAGAWEVDPSDEWQLAKPGWEYRSVSPPNRRYWAYSREHLLQLDREGRLYHSRSGRPRLKQYADEMPGVSLQDLWTDIPPINSQARERIGYPTQKPLALLDRIIRASSDLGDMILDPFCGCATTLVAAETLGRRWAGIATYPRWQSSS